jgi:acyl-CoA reductase-like NAD-dependent aldehyde dehydrogenase
VALAPESTAAEVAAAVAAAVAAKPAMAALPGYERAAILRRAGALIAERAEAIATLMAREIGKAIRDARAEVQRSQDTVLLAAEEAIRITGEHVPLDGSPMGAGKICLMLRFPVGVVAAITPFNAPFNLACHKIAPAVAAGNSIVLKSSPQAPAVVHRLVEIFVEAGLPDGALNAIYGHGAGPALIADPRVDFITFTGSSAVGARIRAAAGLRRVALELGGTGCTIVEPDADIAAASGLCAQNAMRLAGQSCISVQNVFVHRAVHDDFAARVRDRIAALRCGDPLDPATEVGTVIDAAAAARIEASLHDAVAAGARLAIGGTRQGAMVAPTMLVDVRPDMTIVRDEIFGPVVNLIAYDDLDAAIAAINAGIYGLQCGVFTRRIDVALKVFRAVRCGGVIVNGTSTWRTDQLAYGGVKASGIGREGPHYAIREMTEERFVLFNQ